MPLCSFEAISLLPGISIVILDRIPDHDLGNFSEFPLEMRDQVRITFAKALQ